MLCPHPLAWGPVTHPCNPHSPCKSDRFLENCVSTPATVTKSVPLAITPLSPSVMRICTWCRAQAAAVASVHWCTWPGTLFMQQDPKTCTTQAPVLTTQPPHVRGPGSAPPQLGHAATWGAACSRVVRLTFETQQWARSIREMPLLPFTSRWSGYAPARQSQQRSSRGA